MNVNVHGVKEVIDRLEGLGVGVVTQKLMDQAAILVQGRVVADTLQGKDAEGKSFKPYSPGYAKLRKEKGLPVDKVDLFFTGKMQAGLMHKTASGEAQIYFAPSEAEKARKHDEGIGVPKREFFRPKESDADAILALLRQRVDEVMRG